MGGEPYQYVVDYEKDVNAALQKLRQDVFRRGEYLGAGRGARTPDEAVRQAEESGTRSILDIGRVADEPDYCCAAPLTEDELTRYFGTTQPSVGMVEESDALWEDLERGMARYFVAYEGGRPTKLVFIGYSFD